jgi:cytochrome P450
MHVLHCSRLRVAVQCLLDSLLLAEDEEGRGMSRQALRDELMTLLVAGQETSAILLAWACAFLAHHPAAQSRAAREVHDVGSPHCPPVPLCHLILTRGRPSRQKDAISRCAVLASGDL